MKFKTSIAVVCALGGLVSGTVLAAGEQFIPMPSYRVGPYAAGGSKVFAGFIDYVNMINARDGGVGGVKLSYEECETEYKTDRAVECYERLKGKGATGASMYNFLATGPVYALTERALSDKIPLVSIGYGRGDAADGSVFPYVFPLVTTYLSQNTAKVKFIAQMMGGVEKLKGKKIVNLYHGSAYGKETIGILDAQAKKYGFNVVHIEVPHPGNEQQSQWQKIRQEKPDWVILRGWGVMTPTALKTAQKVGFPRDKIVGVWWSGSEEDTVPAGEAAKGFIAASFAPDGQTFPAVQDVKKYLYTQGTGNLKEISQIGSVNYNRGIVHGILNVEAIRVAQQKFGKKPLTGEQIQWGLEHLNIDDKRLKELGAVGLMPTVKTSCSDHEGSGAVKFQQWDGKRWVEISKGWVMADKELVRPLVKAAASKYAKEKNIVPRDCSKEK